MKAKMTLTLNEQEKDWLQATDEFLQVLHTELNSNGDFEDYLHNTLEYPISIVNDMIELLDRLKEIME